MRVSDKLMDCILEFKSKNPTVKENELRIFLGVKAFKELKSERRNDLIYSCSNDSFRFANIKIETSPVIFEGDMLVCVNPAYL